MEKSFIDLLEREKICVGCVNRAEGNIEMWRVEMVRLQNTYRQSEYRDADIAKLATLIGAEAETAESARQALADVRGEMREYLTEVLK